MRSRRLYSHYVDRLVLSVKVANVSGINGRRHRADCSSHDNNIAPPITSRGIGRGWMHFNNEREIIRWFWATCQQPGIELRIKINDMEKKVPYRYVRVGWWSLKRIPCCFPPPPRPAPTPYSPQSEHIFGPLLHMR